MLTVDKDGWTGNIKITKKHKPAIKQRVLSAVKAIVLTELAQSSPVKKNAVKIILSTAPGNKQNSLLT